MNQLLQCESGKLFYLTLDALRSIGIKSQFTPIYRRYGCTNIQDFSRYVSEFTGAAPIKHSRILDAFNTMATELFHTDSVQDALRYNLSENILHLCDYLWAIGDDVIADSDVTITRTLNDLVKNFGYLDVNDLLNPMRADPWDATFLSSVMPRTTLITTKYSQRYFTIKPVPGRSHVGYDFGLRDFATRNAAIWGNGKGNMVFTSLTPSSIDCVSGHCTYNDLRNWLYAVADRVYKQPATLPIPKLRY